MSVCESIITHAKNLGVDEAESVLVKRKIITVRITDTQITEIKENKDESLGIRLIHDKKISTLQTTNPSINSVDKAFRLLKHSNPKRFWKNLPFEGKKKLP